jgi:RNA polymerase sigma-70 factor (ECF subfamily)
MRDPTASRPDESPLEAFRDELHRIAAQRLGRGPAKVEVSDLVQQTLLRAHTALSDLRDRSPGAMRAWLRRILVHELADAVRRARRAKRDAARERPIAGAPDASGDALASVLAASQPSPSQDLMRRERGFALADALRELPEAQRRAVVGKHFENRPLKEMAAEMGVSTAAVAGLLRRGLARLRARLADSAHDAPPPPRPEGE